MINISKVIDIKEWKRRKKEEELKRESDLLEEQFQEFTALLKFFISIQEPKMEALNIIIKSNGLMEIQEQECEFDDNIMRCLTIEKDFIGLEDGLASTILNLAPKKTYIHSSNLLNNDTKKMLEEVFGDSVEFL